MLSLLVLLLLGAEPAVENLNCLPAGESSGRGMFYEHLRSQAYQNLDNRLQEYEQLKTPEQIAAWQQQRRAFLIRQLGGFPEKTPLNPQTVGTIAADGYRIEKVIFESQPRHRVTANLYLPEGEGPFPGVLVSSGHSRTGKTADYNQRFGIALARHGMAALVYDPIGQGERSQIIDEQGQPRFNGTTDEHFLVGVGSILVGRNTATYRIWDGIRAVDYLSQRPDIDPQRIGMTGCSGGGTLTSYVMALDERIACAAPACYLTTFRRLLETRGPQDAEQNIFGQLGFVLDQPDYVLMRAPRPTLISSTTGDFFDIAGSWENLRQAKRIYARLGYPERVDLVEVEGPHGVHPANLAAIVQWLQRWLTGRDQAVSLGDLATRAEKELLCTERGQVLLLPDERSVFDLNVERAEQLQPAREKLRSAASDDAGRDAFRNAVRRIAGIRPLAKLPPTQFESAGRVQRDGYHIDKMILRSDSGVPLPALTFHPAEPREEAYLYLHEDGKLADAAPGGAIEKLVREGYVVVAVDLRGQGETGSPGRGGSTLLGDWAPYYLAYLLGRPLPGLHAEDALAAGHFVAHYKTKTPREVRLLAVGSSGVAALHAAALEPKLFASVTLRNSPSDWSSVPGMSVPFGRLTTTVHGALTAYDLPDLAAVLGDRLQRQPALKPAAE